MTKLKNPCSGCPECRVDISTYPAKSIPDWNSKTCKCCYVTYLMAAKEMKIRDMVAEWVSMD